MTDRDFEKALDEFSRLIEYVPFDCNHADTIRFALRLASAVMKEPSTDDKIDYNCMGFKAMIKKLVEEVENDFNV